MYDSHIHSNNSHDSNQSVDEICRTAIEKGLKSVAICDHADMCFALELDTYGQMKKCIREVNEAREKYKGQLKVFQGIEMAEYYDEEEESKKILALCDYDVILGSVHTVITEDFPDSYSRIDFGEHLPEAKIDSLMKRYFEKMRDMVETTDFDILTHINCPIRYINGKYGRGYDIMKFKKEMTDIMEMIISKNIALELNTSGVNGNLNGLMPSEEIFDLYKKMNGKLITIGSDAHASPNIGKGFDITKEFLLSKGYKCYHYFEKRKPVEAGLK